MAVDSGYLGDATGGIGQGLAFILPQNTAAEYAMQLAQNHATQLQQLAKTKQVQAAKSQQQFAKDFTEQKLPEAFAPFDKKLNDNHNKWQEEAAGYYAKTGKNPFNDPEWMKKYNDAVILPAKQSKELGDNYTKLRTLAETDPLNKYSKESKQAVIDYEQTIKNDPFGALNKPLPQLVETPKTVNDLVKGLKPTTDPSNNKAQAFSSLTGDPQYHDILKGYGYNPDLPDFGVYTDPTHPNGKRVWYTNPTFTNHQADLILQNPDDPKSKQVLTALGIDPTNDKYAKEKLQHAITDQNAAMGKAVTDVGSRMDAMVDPEKFQQLADQKANQQFRQESLNISREHLNLDQQKEAREAAKQSGDKDAEDFADKLLSGTNPEAGRQLSNHFKTNPSYGSELVIKSNPAKDKFDITVPAKVKINPKYDPSEPEGVDNEKNIKVADPYIIHLDKNDPIDFKSKVAYLIKAAGGSKQLNKEDKVPTQQPVKKTIKSSDIASKAAASGYSVAEYTKLLKEKGITIQ